METFNATNPSAEAGSLLVGLTGDVRTFQGLPPVGEVLAKLAASPGARRIAFDARSLSGWDSALLVWLQRLAREAGAKGVEVDKSGLPEGVQRLLRLAEAVPERKGARREAKREALLARIGKRAIKSYGSGVGSVAFLGDAATSFFALVRGRARFQRPDLLLFIQEAGIEALPIISLISFLVGVILAFIGAIQLQMFGAQIYIANLVGLAMARDMGAMMTAIIMAGRSGASYAAQIGSMQVNEEIDALVTLGVPPMEFLVLPRMLALMLMMPLLTLYSDLLGMLGGAFVGIVMFDIMPTQYYQQTQSSVALAQFGVGLVKSVVYGAIVAMSGCLKGIQCGRSASAVGQATTSAVVSAIIWIVVSCAGLTVIFHILGI